MGAGGRGAGRRGGGGGRGSWLGRGPSTRVRPRLGVLTTAFQFQAESYPEDYVSRFILDGDKILTQLVRDPAAKGSHHGLFLPFDFDGVSLELRKVGREVSVALADSE